MSKRKRKGDTPPLAKSWTSDPNLSEALELEGQLNSRAADLQRAAEELLKSGDVVRRIESRKRLRGIIDSLVVMVPVEVKKLQVSVGIQSEPLACSSLDTQTKQVMQPVKSVNYPSVEKGIISDVPGGKQSRGAQNSVVPVSSPKPFIAGAPQIDRRYKVCIFKPKTKCTLIKSHIDRSRMPRIQCAGEHSECVRQYKYLGVILDSVYNFVEHAKWVRAKVSTYTFSLKAHVGRGWGIQRRVVETLYDTVCIPMIAYGGEEWAKSMTKSREKASQCAASGATPYTDSKLYSHLYCFSRSGSRPYNFGLGRMP